MGRPPSNGAPSFRFNQVEVAQMEAILQKHEGHVPPRELLVALANKFSNSHERAGRVIVQMKQVWNWFQNRRYALRAKLVKSPGKPNTSPVNRDEGTPVRNVAPAPQQMPVTSGPMVRNTSETPQMEFEAKSARDGAWYDVQAFLSHRYLETPNPEVLVRFAGFGPEEDEWVNIKKHVRQRSLPCEASECIAVLAGDLILCFQEGKEQALYFDAHVLDAQRRRHDVRGCRCRFLVRYDHDQSEEIVPLRKICRRPETDYRLQLLHALNESASASVSTEPQQPVVDLASSSTSKVANPNPSVAASAAPPSIMTAGPSVPPQIATQTPPPSQASVVPPSPTPAPSSYPIPAPTTPAATVSVSQSPTPVSVINAAQVTVPSMLAPVPDAISAPVIVPVTPAPVSDTIPAPAPTPVSVSDAMSAPVSVLVSPAPVPALVSVSDAISAPAPIPVTVSDAMSAPVTVPASPAPALVSVSDAITAPVNVSLSPAKAPVSVSDENTAPVSMPVDPAPAPIPEPMKVESDIRTPSPEPYQDKSVNPGPFVGEAAMEANVTVPSGGTVVLDTKMAESNDPEKAAGRSSESQGQIPVPEKVESSTLGEPAPEGDEIAEAEGSAVTLSDVAGNSNPIASTQDVKE